MPKYVAPTSPTTLEMQVLLANQGQLPPGFLENYIRNNQTGGILPTQPTAPTGPTYGKVSPEAWNGQAVEYAKNPLQNQTVPPYSPPPSLGAYFGFGPLVQSLQNGATLPGMSGTMPNGYVSQQNQQVSPNAFLGMQGNPFASSFQNIATGGLPMMQGLLGPQAPQQQQAMAAPQQQAMAAPQQAMAAPQQQAMAAPMQAQAMPQQGGYGRQQHQMQGGGGGSMGGRGMTDQLRAFLGLDAGFGGGNDPTTGQYTPVSPLGWDQHMLGQYLNRNKPGSFFSGGNPQAGAHWLNTIRRRQMGDPLRQALFGG